MDCVKLKPINRICPRCGDGNYMRIITGKNVGKLNVKCINCNSYYNYDELLKRDNSKPLNGGDGQTMTDFVQTMKDWRRMCRHYSDESVKDGQCSCVDICPLGRNNTACGIMEDTLDSDIEVVAKEVAKWAAEHPEPVYPTWVKWLNDQGIINTTTSRDFVTQKTNQQIPADIAEKLGLKPKE